MSQSVGKFAVIHVHDHHRSCYHHRKRIHLKPIIWTSQNNKSDGHLFEKQRDCCEQITCYFGREIKETAQFFRKGQMEHNSKQLQKSNVIVFDPSLELEQTLIAQQLLLDDHCKWVKVGRYTHEKDRMNWPGTGSLLASRRSCSPSSWKSTTKTEVPSPKRHQKN